VPSGRRRRESHAVASSAAFRGNSLFHGRTALTESGGAEGSRRQRSSCTTALPDARRPARRQRGHGQTFSSRRRGDRATRMREDVLRHGGRDLLDLGMLAAVERHPEARTSSSPRVGAHPPAQKRFPDRQFIPADGCIGCRLHCPYMKMIARRGRALPPGERF